MYPKTVGLRALRENMDKYVERLSKGESFLVLRKSTPVFKMEPVDEWGDEGHWENFDMRDKNGEGMPMEEFSAILKKYIADDERKSKILKEAKQKGKK